MHVGRPGGGRSHRSSTIDIRATRDGPELLDALIAITDHLRAARAALGHDAAAVARQLDAGLAVADARIPDEAKLPDTAATGAASTPE